MINYSTANLKDVDPQTITGKTIKAIDNTAANVLCIEFTDGSSVAIDAIPTELGIPYVKVSEDNNEKRNHSH